MRGRSERQHVDRHAAGHLHLRGRLTRQQFKLDSQGNGYYHLRNVGSGLCVDVNGAGTADGTAVIQ